MRDRDRAINNVEPSVTPDGTGIFLTNSSDNTIESVTATNRNIGVQLSGTDPGSGGNLLQENVFANNRFGVDAYASLGVGNHYLNNDLSGATFASLRIQYDAQFKVVFDAIRQLMAPSPQKPLRRIGFHAREDA